MLLRPSNSRSGKMLCTESKSVEAQDVKGESFLDDENVLCLDHVGGDTEVVTCQNSMTVRLKWIYFMICNLYLKVFKKL